MKTSVLFLLALLTINQADAAHKKHAEKKAETPQAAILGDQKPKLPPTSPMEKLPKGSMVYFNFKDFGGQAKRVYLMNDEYATMEVQIMPNVYFRIKGDMPTADQMKHMEESFGWKFTKIEEAKK